MAIKLDVKPEVEAELARQAERAGQALERYAADLLEGASERPALVASDQSGQALLDAGIKIRGLFTDDEINDLFRRTPSFSRTVNFD